MTVATRRTLDRTRRRLRWFGLLAFATIVAITAPSDAVAAPGDGNPVIVRAFDHTPVYFLSDDSQRDVFVGAEFPTEGEYSRITMNIRLDCPTGGCDPWDRYGTIGVVTSPEGDDQSATVIELARFMTPYGIGGRWSLDVTDLRPLLTGEVTLAASIDTWVGPGSSGGAGWQLSTWFAMTPGSPARQAVAVVPVWSPREVRYGDPIVPTAVDAPTVTLDLPAAARYSLRTFITGHGQGNEDDCSEFCPRVHTIRVNGARRDHLVWRNDCATTGVKGQRGNYWYSRAGWCPGSLVKPWDVDVSRDITGNSARIAYSVTPYVNGCRPGADPFIPATCTLGTSAEYDGGRHTPPIYRLSTVLIAYQERAPR
jgi:hypothetical protein